MRIIIKYEASWRNSFLDGSNNQPLPLTGRKFIGSSSSLKKEGNYKSHNITKDTVMGLLNRLIGDQQKLYQARGKSNYYFKEIEEVLNDEYIKDYPEVTNEVVYLRNMGAEEKGSFTGAIKNNEPIFTSEYSSRFWSVLDLGIDDLCCFVLDGKEGESVTALNPISIVEKLNQIASLKPTDMTERLSEVAKTFLNKYPEFITSFDSKEKVRLLW